jgi:anti-sigma B factor antagonist
LFKALTVNAELPFDVRTLYVDGSVELAVSGEIDLSVAERLWAAIEPVISADRPLVLDMHRVTFFDVSGLRVLLRAAQRLDGDPDRLILRSPSPIVLRVLYGTRADGAVTLQGVHDDVRRTRHRLT